MQSLGPDSWKIAAALMGRHIGGGNSYFITFSSLINTAVFEDVQGGLLYIVQNLSLLNHN